MRAVAFLLLALPACTLYTGVDDDGVDGGGFVVDARRTPDAPFGDGCNQPLPCPAPTAGRVSICGRVLDVETSDGVDVNAAGGRCDGTTLNGACHLWVRFYDAPAYAQAPTGTTPLVPGALRYDDCGRFSAGNLPRPPSGYLGIVTDDAPGTPDDHRATLIAMRVVQGQSITQQSAFSLRGATDVAWTTQAGLGAQTIADRGAVLAIFNRYDGQPPTGVQVTANGLVSAASDYYFDSPDLATISPSLTATSANGAGLRLDTSLVDHGGVGGEPPGCGWGYDLAASAAGVLWVLPVPPFCKI